MSARPLNVLVIMTEQFSALADPAYAPAPTELPAMSRFREQAVRFERACCNAPVCGPSRLSFLTGRFPHRIDGFDNGSQLPPHVPTFAHLLTANDYHTLMCGRMHIHGLDQYAGFEARLASEIVNPLMCNPADWPARPGVPEQLQPAPTVNGDHTRRFKHATIFDHDPYVTQRACRFLDQHAAGTQPFLLTVGYFAAHTGCRRDPALEPLYRKYLERELPVPEFTPDDFDALSAPMRRLHGALNTKEHVFDREHHRHQMALYLASCEYADAQIGQVLEALERSGLADDTAVIVTSDHGEMMGRDGLWGKMNFREPATRIPMAMRVPGVQPGVVSTPVSLVDVLPTIAELAQMGVPVPTDGRSLLRIRDEPDTDDRPIFGEYHGYCAAAGTYMLLDQGRYKLTHHALADDEDELFDIDADPLEQHNLIRDARYAAERQRCRCALREHVDVDAVERRVAEYNAQRALTQQALNSSGRVALRARRRIDAYRDRVNEPWWDGGKYNASHEPNFAQTDSLPGIGLDD